MCLVTDVYTIRLVIYLYNHITPQDSYLMSSNISQGHNSHNSVIIKRVITHCEICMGLEPNKWIKKAKRLPTFNLSYINENSHPITKLKLHFM
jgi:hypothetical protein